MPAGLDSQRAVPAATSLYLLNAPMGAGETGLFFSQRQLHGDRWGGGKESGGVSLEETG